MEDYLSFSIILVRDGSLEGFRDDFLLEFLVLAEGKESFNEVLGEREADDKVLPREEGPVEERG